MKTQPSVLKHMLKKALMSNKYYSAVEAEKIAEVYLFAELTGKNSMGIVKLMGPEPSQDIQPKYPPKIVKETPVSALIDGGGAAGPLAAQVATDILIEKAKKTGLAITGSRNTFSSTGALSFYAHKIAKENLIGIIAAGSPRAVAFHGGIEAVFGTNPIAFGFPTNEQPVVFDMATSAIAFSGLVRAKALGKKIPENIAIDKNGKPTTDPAEAMVGAILPFDRDYKGSGLGLIVELLTGPLTGASYVFDEGDWGTFYMAFSPDLLGDTESFREHASDLVHRLKASKTTTGEPIHIPGYDNFAKTDALIEQDGEVEIDDAIFAKLQALQ